MPGLDGVPANSEIGPEIYDSPKYKDAPGPLLGYRDDAGKWQNLPPRETAEQITIGTLKKALADAATALESANAKLDAIYATMQEEFLACDPARDAAIARALLARLEMPV